jgi:hypothetical protein
VRVGQQWGPDLRFGTGRKQKTGWLVKVVLRVWHEARLLWKLENDAT